jgi:hypothetical protein
MVFLVERHHNGHSNQLISCWTIINHERKSVTNSEEEKMQTEKETAFILLF